MENIKGNKPPNTRDFSARCTETSKEKVDDQKYGQSNGKENLGKVKITKQCMIRLTAKH